MLWLLRGCVWLLLLLLECPPLSLSHSHSLSSETVHHRVAYVFAGSARSFKDPFIHESIRMNLIHSFCPPALCHSVLLARVSLSDNKHQSPNGTTVKDANGINIPADINEKPIVMEALRRLARCPQGRSCRSAYSPLLVTWADGGTAQEKANILEEFPDIRHKIFSQLDARRYSMYYNRYKSYQRVLDYEKEYQMNFTWVVHVRLDSVWGEPIQPVTFWSSLGPTTNHKYGEKDSKSCRIKGNATIEEGLMHEIHTPCRREDMKVWVVDTWWCEVPDTFALLPRYYSDQYFDLDSLVYPGVMCLGGPNFDYNSTTKENLKSRGYNEEAIKTAQKAVCSSLRGQSEFILKRKLQHFGIDLEKNTLGYTALLMSIARVDYTDLCFFLEFDRLIGWIANRQYTNRATQLACHHMMSFIRFYAVTIGSITSREKAVTSPPSSGIISTTSQEAFQSECHLDNFGEYTGINCLLDKYQTDWYVPVIK